MDFSTFKRIVTTFADEDNEVVVDESCLLLYIRGKMVEAELKDDPENGIIVVYQDEDWPARQWIFSCLANLRMLADRIISYIHPPETYVSPDVNLLDWKNEPIAENSPSDSITRLQGVFTKYPAGVTSIYFLTSDAGEGKTSLIEKISVEQAKAFKNKEAHFLILPVSLGGRSFLRFDDVVIASLMNRLRFPFLYYDSFIELVRMKAIIPAFDGFEEVLVDVSSNEAVSAIGHLVDQLSSSGTILVAARKAYFDSSLNSQAKLLDSIKPDHNVRIQRIVLNRWDRGVFLKYASIRGVAEPENLYQQVKNRLDNKDHPMLTRAVLVRRLIDVAKEENNLDKFLQRLGRSQLGYFFDFIETIVEREASEKWVDRSGTDNSPLLTLDEHYELLSQLALEMWVNAVDALRSDVIRLIIEFFAAEKNKSNDVERQIIRRIQDHSLLREDKSQGPTRHSRIRFDHEEFQDFYLGQALARALCARDSANARLILNAHALTRPVILETTRYLTTQNIISIDEVLASLARLSHGGQRVSYIRGNCGILMIELAKYAEETHSIRDIFFPANALQQRSLRGLEVHSSYFGSTSLDNSEIFDCKFYDCEFEDLILNNAQELRIDQTVFDNCTFYAVSVDHESEEIPRRFRDPDKIPSLLSSLGFNLKWKSHQKVVLDDLPSDSMDDDMKTVLRFIRMFQRATTVHESLITQRLGSQSGYFMNQILPKLIHARLVEVTGNSNNKYRLIYKRSEIDDLVNESGNKFTEFIQTALIQELA